MFRKPKLPNQPQFRRFVLERSVDVTGVSGSGVVAAGVVFPSGKCATNWRATPDVPVGSVALYDSIEQVVMIHGHGGETVVRFLDSLGEVLDAGSYDVIDEMVTARPLQPARRVGNGNGEGSIAVAPLLAEVERWSA